jgi:hypothetical protein
LASAARAYPGGTPDYVADVAPYCAGCHSSVSAAQFPAAQAKQASTQLAENKHLGAIANPQAGSPYAKLAEKEIAELIDGIKKIDAATSVKLTAPASAKPGQEIEVSVEATGGAAPVVGLALVDSDQRWQASPVTAQGFQVVGKPVVTGPDGAVQTKFTDGRNPSLQPGTSYVNVYGITADPAAGKYSTVKVKWKLRAPASAGKASLAAVLFYGTELSSPHGAVESAYGKSPIGGFTSGGGRIKFSEVRTLAVQ